MWSILDKLATVVVFVGLLLFANHITSVYLFSCILLKGTTGRIFLKNINMSINSYIINHHL